jgi:putative FmdB family regulatory protein
MPTYEYECAACTHHFEALQSIRARPLRKCPACGRTRAHRLISAGAGLIFKGSGFYCTDYRTPSEKKARAEQGKKSDSPAKSSEAKPPKEIGGKAPAEPGAKPAGRGGAAKTGS